MTSHDLVRMANQIAAFFGAYPEPEAARAIAGHMRDFWDPGMRASLREHIASGGTGLDALVITAAKDALE